MKLVFYHVLEKHTQVRTGVLFHTVNKWMFLMMNKMDSQDRSCADHIYFHLLQLYEID